MEPKTARNKAMLTNFLDEAWTGGEFQAVDRYLSDSYTIHHDPGDPWDGQTLSIEGFKDRLVKSRAMAPDQVFCAVHMIAEGDQVAAAWTWSGTHLGDIPGIPATGRKITMSGLTVYTFKDGRLSGHWQVADRLSVFQRLTQPEG